MYFSRLPLEIQKYIIQHIKIKTRVKYELIHDDGEQTTTIFYKENKLYKLVNNLFNYIIK